ncbi:uncharacterized protein [Nicotiana tomentosiformis]|nr:uncharacterized protein LOC104106594 isoform X3 [Nicotiana tomentosiformis]
MPSLNAKIQYIREAEKKIEDISVEIDNLTTALSKLQHHSSRINTLEEKVRLLWDVARKNNFEIHTLEFKAQDGQKRLEVLASQVEKMAEIVSEQWIQIQQLEQAVQMAEMRTLKVKRQLRSSKCPFVKFIKNVFGHHLETLKGILHPYGSYSKADPNSYWDQALHPIQRTFASARQYHYELQKFVKHEIERNGFPVALANEEVVFLVRSLMEDQKLLKAFVDDSICDSLQEMKDSLSKDFADICSMLMKLVGKKSTTSIPPRGPVELERLRGGNPESWILQAERYFEFYSIADNIKLSLASSYLDGEALAWFQWLYRNKKFVDRKHFTEKLKLHYHKWIPPASIGCSADLQFCSNCYEALELPRTQGSPLTAMSHVSNFFEFEAIFKHRNSEAKQMFDEMSTSPFQSNGGKFSCYSSDPKHKCKHMCLSLCS